MTKKINLILTENSRRYNFNNIWNSFILIFQLLIGDNWNNIMYDWMRTTSNWAFLYFVVIIIIGTIIMINLLIAIIISNFDNSRFYITKMKMINSLKEQLEDGKTHYTAVVEVLGEIVAERAFRNDKLARRMMFKNWVNTISATNKLNPSNKPDFIKKTRSSELNLFLKSTSLMIHICFNIENMVRPLRIRNTASVHHQDNKTYVIF